MCNLLKNFRFTFVYISFWLCCGHFWKLFSYNCEFSSLAWEWSLFSVVLVCSNSRFTQAVSVGITLYNCSYYQHNIAWYETLSPPFFCFDSLLSFLNLHHPCSWRLAVGLFVICIHYSSTSMYLHLNLTVVLTCLEPEIYILKFFIFLGTPFYKFSKFAISRCLRSWGFVSVALYYLLLHARNSNRLRDNIIDSSHYGPCLSYYFCGCMSG